MDAKPKLRSPKREPRVPSDTIPRTEIAGLIVEVTDVELYPDKARGMVGQMRVHLGPIMAVYRIIRVDGKLVPLSPGHMSRGWNGRTKGLHRIRFREDADGGRLEGFLLSIFDAAVCEWGYPLTRKTSRPRPHRIHTLVDTVEHIADPQAAWETLLEGLTKVIKDENATSRELESACRMLSRLMDREFKRQSQALEALATIGDPPRDELLRQVMAAELGVWKEDSASSQ